MDVQGLKKEEKKALQQKFHLYRWYRQKSEADPGQIKRIGLTAVISFGLGVGGAFYFLLIFNAPFIAACAGIGIFIGGLAVNPSVRTRMCAILKSQRRDILDMHGNARYYTLKGHDDALFIQTDNEIVALGFLELKEIPLMIRSNLARFTRVMYKREIPIMWMITLAPLHDTEMMSGISDFEEENGGPHDESRSMGESSQPVSEARVLIGTFVVFKPNSKRTKLYDEISAKLDDVETTFRSIYPHSMIARLHGRKLYQAFTLVMTFGGIPA